MNLLESLQSPREGDDGCKVREGGMKAYLCGQTYKYISTFFVPSPAPRCYLTGRTSHPLTIKTMLVRGPEKSV